MHLLLPLLAFLALFLSHTSAAQPATDAKLHERPELERCFAAEKANGTFVLFDLPANTLYFCNRQRAAQRFVPASTFKIPNTLIGLDAGAVRDVDQVLPYGGKPQFLKEWEHDMALREAMRISAVPIYQELARRIGLQRMSEKVKAFQYGNQTIGTAVDRFWLDGPLEISAFEQVHFLERLVNGKLPVSASAVTALKEITLQEHHATHDLHYKTGWAMAPSQIGWIVGWVTTKEGTSPFALNIDMAELGDAPKRLAIAKACLGILGKL